MRKRSHFLLSSAVIALLAVGLYYVFSPSSTGVAENKSDVVLEDPKTILAEKWQAYTPTPGHFTALLPSLPQQTIEVVNVEPAVGAPGMTKEKIVYRMFLSQSPLGTAFLVNEVDYPPSTNIEEPMTLIEDIAGQLASEQDARSLVSKTKGQFLGAPAIDLVLKSSKNDLFTRVFVVAHTAYILTVIDSNYDRGHNGFERMLSGFSVNSPS